MELLLLGVIIGFPLLALLSMAAYAHADAPRHGMSPRKWALISFFVPFFGFAAYIFERDERRGIYDERDEHFTGGPFEVHKSRAEETALEEGGENTTGKDGGEDSAIGRESATDEREHRPGN